MTPAVLGLDFLAICFSLIAITDREIDENSYSYYVALFFYGLTHVVYLANSFMEDPSTTNLASRLLKNDNFQLLAFAAIFWFSWPWMWIVLPALMVPAAFQIVEVIPQMASALNLNIPPAVTGALDKVKPHRPNVLNYLAVAEPLYLIYLFLIIYWNGIISIVPYFLWVCARNEYSPYTKFAMGLWDAQLEKGVTASGQSDKIKPHLDKAKHYLGMVGANLPK